MRKGIIMRQIFGFLFLAFFLIGCSMDTYSPGENPLDDSIFEMADELFVPDSGTDESGRTVTRFYTNDVQYWGLQGYSLWTAWDSPNTYGFANRTVWMSKTQEYNEAGFGIVFCEGVRTIDGVSKVTMLMVMINASQQYIIGKVVDGYFSIIKGWTQDTNINVPAGSENKITVVYDPIEEQFTLKINDAFIYSFEKDESEHIYASGKDGYVVIIASQDDFAHGQAVSVLFKELR
jgi:hypothetical protein